jgi:ADP-ribose pyrophosphatase YjhB (NUDIX family)
MIERFKKMFEMGRPIRNSVKGIIIKDQKILLTINKDSEGIFYLLPGGGQHFNETIHQALIRECLEETGYTIKPERLIFIRDYIGKNHRFKDDVHQIEMMFRCQIVGELKLKAQAFDSYQVGMRWIPLANLKSIRLYPNILKKVIHDDGKFDDKIYLGDVG